MDQRELQLRARLHAIELVISEIAAAIYGEGEPTLEDLDRNIKAFLPKLSFPDLEPVHSDLLAGEIEDALRRLLSALVLRARGGPAFQAQLEANPHESGRS